jgi:hypothetical protein
LCRCSVHENVYTLSKGITDTDTILLHREWESGVRIPSRPIITAIAIASGPHHFDISAAAQKTGSAVTMGTAASIPAARSAKARGFYIAPAAGIDRGAGERRISGTMVDIAIAMAHTSAGSAVLIITSTAVQAAVLIITCSKTACVSHTADAE